jgi:hypothetical protein
MSLFRADIRTKAIKAVALILGASSVLGCEHWDGGGYGPRTVSYSCERGPGLNVEFRRNTARIINRGGPPIILQRQWTQSGFWFESATHSIRGQGRRLTFIEGRMTPIQCWESRSGWR